jgi:hypothetical protein
VSAESDARRLAGVLRREGRSFLQYLRAADLWSAPADRALLTELHRFADTEAAALDRMAAFLQSRRVPLPSPGAFPQAFTALNFVAVRWVLPRLLAEQEREAAELEQDAAALADGWRGPAAELLDLKHAHLKGLRALAAAARPA